MTQQENKTKNAIKDTFAELFPNCFQLMVVPGGFGKNGIPDHICCAPVTITQEMVGQQYGMFIAAEAKTTEGAVKGIQLVRLAEIVASDGMAALVVGPEDAERFKKILNERFYLNNNEVIK